jgi:hypothetical protein
MLDTKRQIELKAWRESAQIEDRKLAALEMIADQLAFIDMRLFNIQNKPSGASGSSYGR